MATRRQSAFSTLVRRVMRDVRRYGLVGGGKTVVVAVSGGADSVFLAHAMANLAPTLGLTLHVAHFDHGWRATSRDDVAFVGELAAGLAVPFHTERGDTPRLARAGKSSPEEAARAARYKFLAAVARRSGATTVATGHTQDDQVETVLLALLRGSGPLGLGGMARQAALPAPDAEGIDVVRPLLDVPRAAIRTALRGEGVAWREDESNEDRRFPRNRLRREVLPALEPVAPGFRRGVLRSASLAGAAGSYLHAEGGRIAPGVFSAQGGERGGLRAKRRALLDLHPALRGEVLRWAVGELQGTTHDLEWAHVHGALETIERGRGGAVAWLSRRLRLRLERGDVVVEYASASDFRAGRVDDPPAPGNTFQSQAP